MTLADGQQNGTFRMSQEHYKSWLLCRFTCNICLTMSARKRATSTKCGQGQRLPGNLNVKKTNQDHKSLKLWAEHKILSRVSLDATGLSKQSPLPWSLSPHFSAHAQFLPLLRMTLTIKRSWGSVRVNFACSSLSCLWSSGLETEEKDCLTESLLHSNDSVLSMAAVMSSHTFHSIIWRQLSMRLSRSSTGSLSWQSSCSSPLPLSAAALASPLLQKWEDGGEVNEIYRKLNYL